MYRVYIESVTGCVLHVHVHVRKHVSCRDTGSELYVCCVYMYMYLSLVIRVCVCMYMIYVMYMYLSLHIIYRYTVCDVYVLV